jgi:outer membrane immunogenic protein
MKRRLSFGIAVTASVFATGALAADLPVKAPPVVAVVYNWTGFYMGGNVGYSWGRGRTDQDDTTTSTTVTRLFRGTTPPANEIIGNSPFNAPTGVFPQTTTATAFSGTSNRADVNGGIGGGQFGYNWQQGKWLVGLEADFQGSGERGSVLTCTFVGCPAGSTVGAADYRLNWFGTLRGRAGLLATDRLVLYATGGLAYGQLDVNYTSGVNGLPLTAVSTRTTRAGYTIGAGAEAAIDRNWSVKAEYLYMDLGSFDTNLGTGAVGTTTVTTLIGPFGPTTVATTTASTTAQARSRFSDNILRVGVNYRFGGPVVARY